MANPILQDVMDAINQMQNDITFIKGKLQIFPQLKEMFKLYWRKTVWNRNVLYVPEPE